MSVNTAKIKNDEWHSICREQDIISDTGVCAIFDNEQVAIFKARKTNQFYAVSNFDPIGEANVLSRGILGSIGDRIVVSSPLFKQHFCLQTGQCLEEDCKIKTYRVRTIHGEVQLSR